MDSDRLRDALAGVAAAVAVVATRDGEIFRGLTATSFTGVSIEPPLVLVALDALGVTIEAVLASAAFTVSVMPRSAEFVAERLAGRAPAPAPAWTDVPHGVDARGLPILDGALAWFSCELAAVHPAGDHRLLVGRVVDCGRGPGDPLVLWDRSYWSVG